MILIIKTKKDELIKTYLKTMNGNMGLTEKEIELTSMIISEYIKHGKEGLREPYLSKFVFSTEGRKFLCESLDGLSSQNLGNKFKQLVDKGVLGQDKGNWMLNPQLLPNQEVTFKFEIIDG